MRKLLLALFAMALVVAFTAPAYAAMGARLQVLAASSVFAESPATTGDRNDDADEQRPDTSTR